MNKYKAERTVITFVILSLEQKHHWLNPRFFCTQFACSVHVCKGFLGQLRFHSMPPEPRYEFECECFCFSMS